MSNTKTHSIIKFMTTVLCTLFLAVLLANGTEVQAAPSGQVTNIKQTKAFETSLEVQYTGLLGTGIHYDVRVNTVNDGKPLAWTSMGSGSSGTAHVSGLPASGSTYYLCIIPYTGGGTSKSYGAPSAIIDVVTKPSVTSNMTITQTAASTNGMSLTWNPVAGANRYRISYYPELQRNYTKTITVANPAAALGNLTANANYHINLYAQRVSSTGFVAESDSYIYKTSYAHKYSSTTTFPVLPSKASVDESMSSLLTSIKTIDLRADEIAAADGYDFEVYTAPKKAKKAKKIISTSTSSRYASMKNKKLKKYQVVKVRIRGFVNLSASKKITGAWSDWTYVSPRLNCSLSALKNVRVKASWSKVSGVTRYVVKISTNEKTGFKKVATTKKNHVVISKCGKKRLKKNKVYYFQILSQKKVGKKYVTTSTWNSYGRKWVSF